MAGKGRTGPKKKVVDPVAVERHAAEGLAEYQIAERLGMCQDTFAKRKGENPAIGEALERGRQAARGRVENVAYQCALMATEKPQYQTSLIFWLKAKAGWKERQQVELTGADGAPLAVSFYLPENGRDDASGS